MATTLPPLGEKTLGEAIPPDTPHAVSVSLPTWKCNVGYEEGETWVLDKMQCGYPRFMIHKSINRLAQRIVNDFGSAETDKAMLFPSTNCAKRCVQFILEQNPDVDRSLIRTLKFVPMEENVSPIEKRVSPRLTVVIYPKSLWPSAKAFWQHVGEGVSSRRADFCEKAYVEGSLVEEGSGARPSSRRPHKGPRRYQKSSASLDSPEAVEPDSARFVEERFGRNLDVQFAAQAKFAIRQRIAGSLSVKEPNGTTNGNSPDSSSNERRSGFSVDDVYLFPTGMNAIFHAHQTLMKANGKKPSVMYGFPYVDTLKVLEKFGPGAQFYGLGNSDDLDDLERRLENGEEFLALFCEFPSNPLLRSPNLARIRALADKYNFAVVIDETIGNFLNVHVLPYADILVSSLTKMFSGDSNVMGGSLVVNPNSPHYAALKRVLGTDYEDNLFEEDSIYLERNSRDFASRTRRVNHNAELICELLLKHPAVKQVNYPRCSDTREFYDRCRLPDGGYGGLLSCTFYRIEDAQVFHDNLQTHKGPSLGTNFTLCSPFVILAHYTELEWAARYGCEANLVRFSVGLEDSATLKEVFERALATI
ncbi:cystathionine gamma-synthase-like protein [Piedraia hortae CBS 480.64]|uniref:cystathionine gamma-synthase n=1 Tax=Piedraia hortae CBS 480.64 TaxID=1314780 RepID=A0A6A7BTX3_9PEZI|nr:cystathionine gamma-synthase-like protein [Piedraia hortae CBS 480.64]